MFERRFAALFAALGVGISMVASVGAALSRSEIAKAVRTIRAVGPEGAGNQEASLALKKLNGANASSILPILNAMSGAEDLAMNWLRASVETIASREIAAGHSLPVAGLEKFLTNTSNPPRARRLAFELIARVDAVKGESLIAGMLNDPGPELRRDAVGRKLAAANQLLKDGSKEDAKSRLKELLAAARDVDQVDEILKQLKTLGETVDLASTFGFVTRWKVVGPFDSAGGKGFAAVYPPEEKLDLSAEYQGKSGAVRWQDFTSKDDYGNVSMNLPFTPLKGVAAYAVSEFYADKPQPVELRVGSENSFKVWLNGKFLFGQDEYHRNKAIDQYRINGQLQPGKNVILVKVCQNEQTEDWAGDWDFQIRVCDPLGTPLRSAAATEVKR